MRKLAISALLLTLLIPAVACSSANTDGATIVEEDLPTDEESAEGPTAVAPEEEEEAEPVDTEGQEVVETTDPTATPEPEHAEVQIIPLEVLDPAAPGTFAEVPDGSRLVGVRLAVENRSAEPISINPLNFTLRDEEGLVVEVELGASDELRQLPTLTLYENERIAGWVFYVLEQQAQPAAVKMTANIFSSEGVSATLDDLTEPDWEPIAEEPATRLGETASANGVELTVLSVVDPATPGMFYTPVEGSHLIAVEVQLRNADAAEPVSVNPLYLYMVDNLGFVHEAELGASEQEQIPTRDLASGEAMKGFVSYVVPDGRSPLYIRYAPNFFNDNELLEAGAVE